MFYADYDEKNDLWCVFHIDTEKAYSSFSNEEEAETDACSRNQ